MDPRETDENSAEGARQPADSEVVVVVVRSVAGKCRRLTFHFPEFSMLAPVFKEVSTSSRMAWCRCSDRIVWLVGVMYGVIADGLGRLAL